MNQDAKELLSSIETLEKENHSLRSQLRKKRHLRSAGGAMITAGVASLFGSVIFGSSVLAFTGLGLTFWGVLLIFARAGRSIRVDVVSATIVPITSALTRILNSLDYTEKGIYIPDNHGRVLLFIPSKDPSRLPTFEEASEITFLKEPNGVCIIPPGIGLAEVIQRELGVKPGSTDLEAIAKELPSLLDDLEIARDVEIRIEGQEIGTRIVEPLSSGTSGSMRVTMCDEPISSAVACIAATALARPVKIEKQTNTDGTVESVYRIL
jgi:hypothetical protein